MKAAGATMTASGKRYMIAFNGLTMQVEVGSRNLQMKSQSTVLNAAPIMYKGKLYLPIRLVEKLGCTIKQNEATHFVAECQNYALIASDDLVVW